MNHRESAEGAAHGIGEGGVLVEDFQAELVGPPIAVGAAGVGRRGGLAHGAVEMGKGAFAAGGGREVFHERRWDLVWF